MGLKGWLRKLERGYRGEMVRIPQPDGTIAQFREKDLATAFLVAHDRELGRSTEDHPLCRAARRSPDPKWSESFVAGPEVVRDPPPDLSE